jgi:deoxyribodipyrimidine photolyase-related protein
MHYLIFPNQLFYNIKNIDCTILLIEEPRYFTDFKFHKLKLAYHHATMKKYYDYLKKKNFKVKYINYNKVDDEFYEKLKNVTFVNPIDHKLLKKLNKLVDCTILDSPQFLLTVKEVEKNKHLFYKNNKYSNAEFYKFMRKKLDILIKNDKPIGGSWSYDKENRKKLPKDIKIDEDMKVIKNKYTVEAIKYVNKNFSDNYGSLENFIYPIDRKSSLKWLNNFLEYKLKNFGPYEDAVSTKYNFVFHSVLTPMMNIGLLLDDEVVKISNDYYLNHKVPIESFEGFIRQVIGWRTYIYSIYILDGDTLYKSNLLNHTRKLNNDYWEANTGIEPIDFLINKVVKYAYLHHIERLMYLGNWFLINKIDSKEVYKIFMEWTIDAYDWVMVPNIYGMSQYASNMMMTKPYFSSSNYILKMSDFKKGKWCIKWDANYYNFINTHIKLLEKNYGTAIQVKHWKNKSKKEKDDILSNI